MVRSARFEMSRTKRLSAETIKRTNHPYFVLERNICALLAAKNHVNIFIYDPIAPDPEGIINQRWGNQPLGQSRCARTKY